MRVFNKVLAAVDGSDITEYVKSWSEGLGEGMNSLVDYITVFQVVPDIYMPLVGWNKELENNLNLSKKEMFSHLGDMLRKNGYNFHELEGKPDKVIVDFAKKGNYNLIILGFKGGGKSRIPIGSTALNVTKDSHTNVLLVNGRFKGLKSIGFAESLEGKNKTPLLMVFALAKIFGAKVYRVHVIDEHFVEHSPDDLLQELRFEIGLELQKAVPGVNVKPVILEGDPSFELYYWAAKNNIDLMVFPEPPGELGLITEEFLMQTPTNVLICRGL
ncbi:MAG: universal stress protein [candidate division WOR-3 bacterium]